MIEPRRIPNPGVDPLDSTGRRCVAESTRGKCHRRYDHAKQGDDRHWCFQQQGDAYYEWKDDE